MLWIDGESKKVVEDAVDCAAQVLVIPTSKYAIVKDEIVCHESSNDDDDEGKFQVRIILP